MAKQVTDDARSLSQARFARWTWDDMASYLIISPRLGQLHESGLAIQLKGSQCWRMADPHLVLANTYEVAVWCRNSCPYACQSAFPLLHSIHS